MHNVPLRCHHVNTGACFSYIIDSCCAVYVCVPYWSIFDVTCVRVVVDVGGRRPFMSSSVGVFVCMNSVN